MYHRCSICNKVSNPEIATFPSDYDSRINKFSQDPHDSTKILCSDCVSASSDAYIELTMGDEEEEFINE